MSTLTFAQDVRKVKNRATANEVVQGENVTALKKEIDRLKLLLHNAQGLSLHFLRI